MPSRRRHSAAAIAGAALLLAACGAGDPPKSLATVADRGPRLTLVDSVVLADTGALALGAVAGAGLVVGDTIWVGDRQNGRVVWFARDGRALRAVGRKGEGPGELTAVGPLVPLDGGRVAVWDYGGKLVAYDARDGALRGETPVREQAFPLQLQAVGDTIWTGVVSLQSQTGALRLQLADGALEKLAPAPAEYARGLGHSFPYSVALRRGDSLVVGYAGHHRLFVHHAGGTVDSLVVPRLERRGVPPDFLARVEAGEYRDQQQRGLGLENVVSSLHRLEPLPGGRLALVHHDVDFSQRGDAPAEVAAWLTVLHPSLARACTDARIPLDEPGLPSLAFRGDTLFVLEQVVRGERAVPVVRAWLISTDRCAWLPVPRG